MVFSQESGLHFAWHGRAAVHCKSQERLLLKQKWLRGLTISAAAMNLPFSKICLVPYLNPPASL